MVLTACSSPGRCHGGQGRQEEAHETHVLGAADLRAGEDVRTDQVSGGAWESPTSLRLGNVRVTSQGKSRLTSSNGVCMRWYDVLHYWYFLGWWLHCLYFICHCSFIVAGKGSTGDGDALSISPWVDHRYSCKVALPAWSYTGVSLKKRRKKKRKKKERKEKTVLACRWMGILFKIVTLFQSL